jgi:predicted DNA-binding protein
MTYKYEQELDQEIETRLDNFIERLKKIDWFQPKAEISKEAIEKRVDIILQEFSVEAEVEYLKLNTPEDWSNARVAAEKVRLDAEWAEAYEDAYKDTWRAAYCSSLEIAWDMAFSNAINALRDVPPHTI